MNVLVNLVVLIAAHVTCREKIQFEAFSKSPLKKETEHDMCHILGPLLKGQWGRINRLSLC